MKEINLLLKKVVSMLSLDVEHLSELPCYAFWKNKEGIYLGYNDFGAINLGYENSGEILGKTDFDIFPKNIAAFFVKNDHDVMASNIQKFIPEPGVLKNNYPVVFMSYKMPVYDANQSIIGVLGLAFTRPSANSNYSPTELARKFNHPPKHTVENNTHLTTRENTCIRFLCKGLTIKEIAQTMSLSPRTIETYLNRAKVKMHCENKAALIHTFIEIFGPI